MVTTLIMSTGMTISAGAIGNITDRGLPNKFITSEKSAVTEMLLKKDESFHYIKNTSGISLKVASRVKKGNNIEYRTFPKRFVKVHYGEYFIHNEVYERNGYSPTYCQLQLFALEWKTSGYISGLWSPDSVGNYPVAN